MAADKQGRRLGKRSKPLRRTAKRLTSEPVEINPEDGPVVIDAEHKDGRYMVRITPATSPVADDIVK